MRSRFALGAVLAVTCTAPVAVLPAHAAGPTCNGLTPTIVGTAATEVITGTAGRDIIVGGLGVDTISGLGGDDVLCGGDGNDVMIGGAGDDVVAWAPGDDSDTIEGQGGIDRLVVLGSLVTEQFGIAPNGTRLLVTRDVAAVSFDVDGVEKVAIAALAGDDRVQLGSNGIDDTDLTALDVDLTGVGSVGDAWGDELVVHGTQGDDTLTIGQRGARTTMAIRGVTVAVSGHEIGRDTLLFDATGGTDTALLQGSDSDDLLMVTNQGLQQWMSAGHPVVVSEVEDLRVSGRGGDDQLVGSWSNETLLGDGGNDRIVAGPGSDDLRGGGGNDLLVPGPGDDAMAGGSGADTASFVTSLLAVTADLGAGTASGDGADTLTLVERLLGSDHDDVLSGDGAANRLTGGNGDDQLNGRGGQDTCAGGSGTDTASGCETTSSIP